jgi:hypothetical protein
MELNLDRLNGLRFADFQEKQPSKTPTDELLGAEEYKTSAEQEHALKRQIEGLGALQRKADQNKAEIDRNLEVYRTYQENIKRSGQLQTDILKGVQAGEDIYSLFLKAVQAISCMTSNKTFYSQVEADLISIYGIGLQQPAPLKLELMDTQKRLDRLREAEQREPNIDSIKRAITAHQNRIAELEKQIAKAQDKPA